MYIFGNDISIQPEVDNFLQFTLILAELGLYVTLVHCILHCTEMSSTESLSVVEAAGRFLSR